MLSLDDEWDNFMNGVDDTDIDNQNTSLYTDLEQTGKSYNIPKCSGIYISTKTKIAYLNTTINLAEIFWNIKVIDYCLPKCGVIKKQMKFNSLSKSDLSLIESKLDHEVYKDTYIITHIDNPDGRIKFKDIRKISVGLSKKDILSYRCKQKSAFYNCFVLIIRLKENYIFKEFHVKIFNTGKLEIPGIQNDDSFLNIISFVENLLSNFYDFRVKVDLTKTDTVLINSNFTCGFYINREKFADILKYKYKIQSIYDPCSYPGIQCKFYHDDTLLKQTGKPVISKKNVINESITLVSFMIFRTGSVLIVGKCDEAILNEIYLFIKNILIDEYPNINQSNCQVDKLENKIKAKKIRKKTIYITNCPKDH